jgi:A/G-specific adenine glycosylase
VESLYRWYRSNGRSLPWRETRDPYAIWISEIMLQQTRVDTVLPYFQRFMARFPDVAALAASDPDEVLKLWEGLGYYARARNLRRGAVRIADEHRGRFPETLDAVAALPGIGRSTAGAILSAAFGQALPVLDGNVRRILLRLDNLAEDPRRAETQARLWARAQRLVEVAPDPFEHNQAMMELGALLCLPRQPRCGECPVAAECAARQAGTAADLPVRGPSRELPHYTIGVGVLSDGEGRVYIQRRPEEGLLGGLWEFPGGKREGREGLTETVRRELEEELGVRVRVGAKIVTVRHAYSHFRITLHAFHCRLLSGVPQPRAAQEGRFVPFSDLERFAFPTANRRILDALRLA